MNTSNSNTSRHATERRVAWSPIFKHLIPQRLQTEVELSCNLYHQWNFSTAAQSGPNRIWVQISWLIKWWNLLTEYVNVSIATFDVFHKTLKMKILSQSFELPSAASHLLHSFPFTKPFRIKLQHLIAIFHPQSNTKLFTYLLVLSNNRRHPTLESSIPTIEILLMANVSNFPRGNNNNLIDRAERPLIGKMLKLHSPNRESEKTSVWISADMGIKCII